jgi:hypothetical protein
VIDDDGRAYLFLGESGAGKTTISQTVDAKKVLGDDMNLLSWAEGQCFVEPAAVGQAIQNTELLGQKFPLHGIYRLIKSEETQIIPMSRSRGALSVYAGAANLFIGDVSNEIITSLQSLVKTISQQCQFYDLHFTLNRKVLDHVFVHQ